MAQIIPKNELVELAHKLHKLRNDLGLNQFCHPKKEDFYDAYSLHKLAEIKTKVTTSPNISGRLTLTFACRLCPGTAFKWQSEFYKHCLMNHFSEQIQILAPAEAPFKCPKCEYIAKARYSLYIHIG